MSISTELTRLQKAKTDIKAAIEAKGVTVPSNDRIDQYPQYINQIETGGGTVSLFEYYKTLAMASCDITEKITTNVSYKNYKIAVYFTLKFEGEWYDVPDFGCDIILKSTDYESSEDNYCTINVAGTYDGSSGSYTCSYKPKTGSPITFASGAVLTDVPNASGYPAITLALNVWCKNTKGYVVSNTTSVYPAIYFIDFIGRMSQKQVSSWGNLEFQNVPMNVKIGN